MTLINCPECNKQVSDSAPSCPNCGVPIASAREIRSVGASLTTIQATSKKLKLHILLSVILLIVGIIWLMVVSYGIEQGVESGIIPALMIFVGLVWFIVTRFRIWWHHK